MIFAAKLSANKQWNSTNLTCKKCSYTELQFHAIAMQQKELSLQSQASNYSSNKQTSTAAVHDS